MADLCPVCGANPCYRICPTQDPYQGNQAAEDADYEFNARYDDIRERYASTAEDADMAFEPMDGNEDDYGDEPTDAEVRRARQSNIDHGRTTRLHPIGGDDSDVPF